MAASGALPVVDLAPFFTKDGKGGIAGATEAVRQACQTHGFFRAVNHGVPVDLMARALELSAAFFALPDEEKAKVRAAQGSKVPVPAGYGRQPAHVADKNEYLVVFDPKLGLSAYPAEPDGFRSVRAQNSVLVDLFEFLIELKNIGARRDFEISYRGPRDQGIKEQDLDTRAPIVVVIFFLHTKC